MRKILLTAAACVAVMLGLAGCWGDSNPKPPAANTTTATTTTDRALVRARELLQGCKVRQTVSLHDGTFYLELRDGTRVDLPRRLEKAIFAEVDRIPRRCPRIVSSME